MSESAIQPPNNDHSAALEAIDTLDDTLNQKARMKIMTTLLALGEADFKLLKEELALSDGNLSTHLTMLEDRGYIVARKEFVRRKPHSSYRPTDLGREAFYRYLNGLMRIVKAASSANTAFKTTEEDVQKNILHTPSINSSKQDISKTDQDQSDGKKPAERVEKPRMASAQS